jgi:hypothetical protein
VSRHALSIPSIDALAMLGTAIVLPWLRLRSVSVRGLCEQAALTVSGHLHRPPDPVLENALRNAFAELDEELGAVLGDRRRARFNG